MTKEQRKLIHSDPVEPSEKLFAGVTQVYMCMCASLCVSLWFLFEAVQYCLHVCVEPAKGRETRVQAMALEEETVRELAVT